MVIIVMGITGAGKTTVGRQLAGALGWRFHDADDFHPPANKAKMNAGVPLTDQDRWPWLRALREVIEQALADGAGAVVTCSALKRAYRDVLAGGLDDVRYVHLTGDTRVVAARLAGRRGHFMNPALLDSQIATLEEPDGAVDIDVALTPEAQVAAIRQALSI
jgi:carbohydrate kinase (thermoresistant glucokinase family)